MRRPRLAAAAALLVALAPARALPAESFTDAVTIAERAALAAAVDDARRLQSWAESQLAGLAQYAGYPSTDPRLTPWATLVETAAGSTARWSGALAAAQPSRTPATAAPPPVDPELLARGRARLAASGADGAALTLNAPALAIQGARQEIRTLEHMVDQRATLRLVEQGRANRQRPLLEEARISALRTETEGRLATMLAPLFDNTTPALTRALVSARLLSPQPSTDPGRKAAQATAASQVASAILQQPAAFGPARPADAGPDPAALARSIEIWLEQLSAEQALTRQRILWQPQLIHDDVFATTLARESGFDLGSPGGLAAVQAQYAKANALIDRIGAPTAAPSASPFAADIQTEMRDQLRALLTRAAADSLSTNRRR